MGFFQNDVDNIVEQLRNWTPSGCAKEADYERALAVHLNQAIPKEVFISQYSMSNTRADLYVAFQNGGAKVAVELKANVTDRGEYHRLLGQIWTYVHEWECEVLVVVCGENDPVLVKLAARFVEFVNNSQSKKVRFFEVKG